MTSRDRPSSDSMARRTSSSSSPSSGGGIASMLRTMPARSGSSWEKSSVRRVRRNVARAMSRARSCVSHRMKPIPASPVDCHSSRSPSIEAGLRVGPLLPESLLPESLPPNPMAPNLRLPGQFFPQDGRTGHHVQNPETSSRGAGHGRSGSIVRKTRFVTKELFWRKTIDADGASDAVGLEVERSCWLTVFSDHLRSSTEASPCP